MRHTWIIVVTVSVLVCGIRGESKDVESPPPEQLNLRRVTLFKNGFGFFVGQAALSGDENGTRFLLPATPVQGTFWLAAPADVNLASAEAEKVQSKGPELEALTIPEILRANVGKRVRITIDEKQVTGRIVRVTESHRMPRILPYAPGVPKTGAEQQEILPPYETGLVLVSTAEGTLSLDPRSIQHVTFPDNNVTTRFSRTEDTVAVRVRATSPAREGSLTVSFLAKGIAWTPSYLVDVNRPGKARLSAKALIINELHDLNDVTIRLATGFPRLQFADVPSPIGMKESLAQFLEAMGEGGQAPSQARPKAYAMAESVRTAYAGAAMNVVPAYGAAQTGVTAEELFLYPAGKVTLPKDRVAYIPLFTEAVPYEDLYEWNIPDYTDESGRFLLAGGQPAGEKAQEVWHSIRLENTMALPWTPAPAEAVKSNMIVGQAELPYTPPGGKATLRISQAPDITAMQHEIEVERKRGAKQLYGIYYDYVTVRGELALTNHKNQSVTVEVRKTLSGEVVSSEPPAKVEKPAAGIQRINGLRKLTWTVEVAPDQTVELTYTYEVYIRGERTLGAP